MIADHPILNPALLEALASAGHTDVIVIADAGLPLPPAAPVIDLSLTAGVPSFAAVARVVVGSLAVESALIAREAAASPAAAQLDDVLAGVPTEVVPHDELKRLGESAHVIIRTGECTPYANVALRCGTTF